MTIAYVTEHRGQPTPLSEVLRGYALSSDTVGPFPGSDCKYIRVSVDHGCFFCFNSASTDNVPTSTNSIRIATLATEVIEVSTRFRLQIAST
jgi:hypothetical protein